MLSGASISETLTTLLIISVAISMLLVVSGCNDRREVIPEEPRLSGAQHDAMVRFHGSESNTIHRVDHSIKATSEITTLPRSTGRSADPVEEQRQHSAWVWLQARQGANLQAAVADYRPDYDIQNRDIQNRPTDYGVIAESDVSQWRASQTLKF